MNYDQYLELERISLDKQERRPVQKCDYCDADIYDGQNYHEMDGEIYCCNCFDEVIVYETLKTAGEE